MERLLGSERRQLQDPDVVLDGLGATPGMTVADIGSGPGFFTLPLAGRVSPGGKVLAVDVEPMMLDKVRERAAEAGIGNIETLLAADDALPLSSESVDAALMVNVLHETDSREALLHGIFTALRPGGALAVVEWTKERTEFGPPPEVRLGATEVEQLLRQAGYEQVRRFDVSAQNYGVRAIRPS